MYGKTCMQRYVLEDIWKERGMCDGKAKKRIIKSGGWKTDHGGWKMHYDGGKTDHRRSEAYRCVYGGNCIGSRAGYFLWVSDEGGVL